MKQICTKPDIKEVVEQGRESPRRSSRTNSPTIITDKVRNQGIIPILQGKGLDTTYVGNGLG